MTKIDTLIISLTTGRKYTKKVYVKGLYKKSRSEINGDLTLICVISSWKFYFYVTLLRTFFICKLYNLKFLLDTF